MTQPKSGLRRCKCAELVTGCCRLWAAHRVRETEHLTKSRSSALLAPGASIYSGDDVFGHFQHVRCENLSGACAAPRTTICHHLQRRRRCQFCWWPLGPFAQHTHAGPMLTHAPAVSKKIAFAARVTSFGRTGEIWAQICRGLWRHQSRPETKEPFFHQRGIGALLKNGRRRRPKLIPLAPQWMPSSTKCIDSTPFPKWKCIAVLCKIKFDWWCETIALNFVWLIGRVVTVSWVLGREGWIWLPVKKLC